MRASSVDGQNRPEQIVNIALGLSALTWAVLGLVRSEPSVRLSAVRMTITALNACAGTLFLLRRSVVRSASPGALAVALPSLVMSGVALRVAGPIEAWPSAASALFAIGGLVAVVSLAFLGRCFALLPAIRGVVMEGPFRAVRHPAYAGELTMIVACSLASPSPRLAWPVVGLSAALLAARILAEERLLRDEPAYRDYMARVRFRLIPGVW